MEPQKQNGKRGPRTKRSPAELVPNMVRYPEYLRARIQESAQRHGRSINAEINWRLERSFWLDDMLKAKLLCELPETAGLSKRPARER